MKPIALPGVVATLLAGKAEKKAEEFEKTREDDIKAFLVERLEHAVAAGIVDSLARPGGNITGDTIFVPEKTQSSEASWLRIPPNRAVQVLGAVVKPGRVMFELAGVPEDLAREAMRHFNQGAFSIAVQQ